MKRILVFGMVLVLLISVIPRVNAVNDVYFTAVNDAFLDLNDETMPFWSGGLSYVPCTVFSGTNLGVFYAQNTTEKTLTLYNIKKTLTFEMNSGTCYDQDGATYSYRTITRNGKAYIPISFVCSFFDLTYSYIKSDLSPIIRIKNSKAVLSDSIFADAAAQLMQYRLNQYMSTQPSPEISSPVVTPTPTPSGGSGKENVRVYLAFDGCPTASTEAILDKLDEYGYKAIFFFSPDQLDGADDLIRRIVGSGHSIGLSGSEDSTAQALLDGFEEGNRRLRETGCLQTRIVSVPNLTSEQYQLLTQNGYCCWSWSINAEYDGATSKSTAINAMSKISKAGTAWVRLADGEITAGAMTRLLSALKEDGYSVRPVSEAEYR
ncbi:polysaccharide deacetylase family protein [Papillibacter cinnamivorans]|uniref:Peptidoglycan/xylan/chitin deacetylase, PgdA/CDA1 family n=1 Tax=Papillibacter cinnamivorans DSM 12816 TaxID=1122930 RepID=A0A1W2AC63_9FIRM|nr:polysaccharide deacetylase family protein [Papillibacter cinnamivorans]SMC57838.1 Peptidoglycan/xylan/chitin deacetylase, PgdA/CDA1 family [Papillibacter cinnamivorans DSM 12816]